MRNNASSLSADVCVSALRLLGPMAAEAREPTFSGLCDRTRWVPSYSSAFIREPVVRLDLRCLGSARTLRRAKEWTVFLYSNLRVRECVV